MPATTGRRLQRRLVGCLVILVLAGLSLTAAEAAKGDVAIFRAVTAGENITTAELVHDFDTTNRVDADSYTLNGATNILCAAGHHLVIYSSRFDDPGNNGNNRSELQTWLRLNGSDLDIGWSQCYIRRQEGDFEGITAGGGIIDVASNGDALLLVSTRTDAEPDGIIRENKTPNIQLVKLDDAWDYCRLSKTNNQTAVPADTNFIAVTYNSRDELDEGSFGHADGTGDITLKTAGHYLVLANTYFRFGQSIDSRSAYKHRLTTNGTQVAGSRTTVYLRGNPNADSCCDGAASIGTIIETKAANVILNVECNKEVGQAPNIIAGRTAITIARLPDYGEYVRLDDSGTDNFNPDSITPLGWDTELEMDATAFTHDDSRIGTVMDDDYLFLCTLYCNDDGGQRIKWWQRWRTDGTSTKGFGRSGRYSRNSGSQASGNWSGIVLGMSEGRYVEVVSQKLGNSGVMSADVKGVQGVRLGSILLPTGPAGSPVVYNTGESMITATSAWMHARVAHTGAAPTEVWCFWGDNDAGTNFAWDATNYLGTVTITPPVEFTNSVTGLSSSQTHYYRYYASNSVAGVWAGETFQFDTRPAGEWYGAVDDMWGTTGNWAVPDVPDSAAEDALFTGAGLGAVDLGGNSYSIGSMEFSSGGYLLTNSGGAATLTAESLTHLTGANTISASVTVTGTTVVAGGTLTLDAADDFNSGAVALSDCTLAVDGASSAGPSRNALLHAGYHGQNNDSNMNLDGNGGLLALAPYGTPALTEGPDGRGLDFDVDNDFRKTGAVYNTDNHASVFIGYFNPPETGTYGFRSAGDDDRSGIWLDLDRDGVFESSQAGLGSDRGEQLAWEDTGNKHVTLTAGLPYLIAFTHREGTGASHCDFRFTMPSVGERIVKPGDPAQAGLWTLGARRVDATGLDAITVTSDSTLHTLSADGGGQFGVLGLSTGTLTMTDDYWGTAEHRFAGISGGGMLDIRGAGLVVDAASSLGTLIAGDGGGATGATITASTLFDLEPACTIHNPLAGAADLHAGADDNDDRVIELLGTNTYTGTTLIRRAVLRADDGVGLSANSGLVFSQNNIDQTCILETRGTFNRHIGTGPGEVYWGDPAGGGGFAARGGDLTIDLAGGAFLVWAGSNDGFNSAAALQFGSRTADSMVNVKNDIMLDGVTRRIQTIDNPFIKTDMLRFSGRIFSGNTNAWFRFHETSGNQFNSGGNGGLLIELLGTNTYADATVIEECALYAIDGVGLPTGSTLRFHANAGNREAVFLSRGSFARDIGTAPGEVRWDDNGGGFAARGGKLTVTLEGGAQVNWGNAGAGFNSKRLMLSSKYADDMVEIVNDIDLNNVSRWVYVFDNGDTKADAGVLSGAITGVRNGGERFYKAGPGVLWLRSTGSDWGQPLHLDNGVVRLDGIGNLSTNTTLAFDQNTRTTPGILECKGSIADWNVGALGEARAFYWGQHGGFAAYDGPLTVNLESGATLTPGGTANGFNGKALQLGSRTADDIVTFENDLYLNNNTLRIQVFDNPDSANDRAVYSGDITRTSNGQLEIGGDGTLDMTGATAINNMRVYDTATVYLNGTYNVGNELKTQQNLSGRLSGTGSVSVVTQFDIRQGGRLAPGYRGVGTLNVTVTGVNGMRMWNTSTCEWEMGATAYDTVPVVGNLELRPGWRLRLLGAGGVPRADEEYDIFTYTGDLVFNAVALDTSEMPPEWDASSATVVHDYAGKRVYLTGLSSTFGLANRKANNLTASSAQLNGTLSCSGAVMDVWAYWGETNGETDAGAWSNAAHVGTYDDVVDADVSHVAAGLAVNAMYYYTFRATNATTDMWAGPSESFVALGPPLVGNDSGATEVGIGTATLRGSFLDHNRGSVTICWGLTDAGTNSVSAWDHVESIGPQTGASFSTGISDAFYPQTYYYRCYATNAYGHSWSDPATNFSMTTKLDFPTNPAAYWALNEMSGTTAADSSGNGHTGTLVGFPGDNSQWIAGRVGGALLFDGSNDEVGITGYKGILGSAPRTMATWIKTTNRDAAFMSWGLNNTGQKWIFRTQTANGLSGAVRVEVNGGYIVGDTDVCDDAWHHVVAVLPQGANNVNQMRLYTDGRLNTVSASQGQAINTTSLDVRLGNDHSNRRFAGPMDEMCIYDRELTEAEIEQLYLGATGEGSISIANVQSTDRTLSTAKLRATLSVPQSVYDVRAYWGAADGGTNATSWGSNTLVGTYTNVVNVDVTHTISGLAPTSTPFYTFCLSNALDTTWASPSMRVPPVSAPVVDHGTGAVVSVGSATLHGNLTTAGVADVTVYWGRSDGGTNAGAWDRSMLFGELSPGAFSTEAAAGYGFTYYYGCYATNAAGHDWADATESFTAEEPVPVVPVTGGLLAHWNAEDITGVANGAQVDFWENSHNPGTYDLTRMGGTPAYDAGMPGLNGHAAVVFGIGGGDWFEFTDITTVRTVFWVLRDAAGGDIQFLLGDDGSHHFHGDDNGDIWHPAHAHNNVKNGTTELNGTVIDGRTTQHPTDFGIISVVTTGNTQASRVSHDRAIAARSWEGEIAEILIYDTPLTSDDEDAVGGYLSWKYGLATAYPAYTPPMVALANGGESDVTANGATLNGALSATGYTVDVWVHWGTGDGGTNGGGWDQHAYVGGYTNHEGPISHAIAGLTGQTDYFYTFQATNAVTNVWAAPSRRFQTAGGTLVVSNNAAMDVARTTATLSGELVAGGGGEARFYWGLADGGDSYTAWANTSLVGAVTVGSFTSAVPVLPGGRYYYRAYVTNASGDGWAPSAATFSALPAEVSLSMAVTREDLGIDPLSISGCALWLAADDIDGDGNTDDNPAHGASVDLWYDKSGNGYIASRDGQEQTAYNTSGPNGRPVVTFDGAYLSTSHNFDSLKEYTVLSVARYTGGDNERVISSATRNWLFGFHSAGDERWFAEGWIQNAGTANTDWHLHAGHINSDTDPKAGFWKDGVKLLTGGTGSHNSNYTIGRLALGGYRLNNQESKCEIAEILIYARVLTDEELGRLGLHLDWKYGLNTAYAESHPVVVAETRGGFEVSAALSSVAASNVTVNFDFGTNATAYVEGMRGSIFRRGVFNDTAINLDGAAYIVSDRRVCTGDQAGTVLMLDEDPDNNVIALGTIQNWDPFPSFNGNADMFATVFSGTIIPRATGSHTFRGQCDDHAWMYIDMAGDNVWDSSDRVFAGDASGTKVLMRGQPYNFILVHREGTGGQNINWYVTEPDGVEQRVSTVDQPGMWNYALPTASVSNDYTVSSTSVVIPAGSLSSSNITLTVIDDLVPEDDEAVTVGIGSLLNATEGYPDVVTGILSSRDPKVTDGGGATDLAGSSATLNGMLTMGDDAAVTLYWGRTDGGTNHSNWGTTVVVGVVDEDYPFSTGIAGLSAAGTYYYRCYATNGSNLAEDWADVTTVFTTAMAEVSIGDVAVIEGDSGAVDAVFTITASATGQPVVAVSYITSNGTAEAGTDYAATSGRVELAVGVLTTQITVQVAGDTELEHPPETFSLVLSSPTNCTIGDGHGTCTIVDDDAAAYLAGFKCRLKITFSGYSGYDTLTNFVALVRLDEGIPKFKYETFASSTGGDLRFASGDGRRLLNHEIEVWATNGESCVWVQVPELPPGDAYIWAHWGNENETTAPAYTTDGSTWTDGHVAVWHMGEQNGPGSTTAPDSAGGHDGTLLGMDPSANWVGGVIANSLNFATANGSRRVSVNSLGQDCPETTVSFWARPLGNGNRSVFYTKQWTPGDLHHYLLNADTIRFAVNSSGFNPGANAYDSTAKLTDGQWTYWTTVYSVSGKIARMYKNGSLHSSRPFTENESIRYAHGLFIGANHNGNSNRMNGRIDELRIGEVVRSEDWIKACYDNQKAGSTFVQYSDIVVPTGTLLILR